MKRRLFTILSALSLLLFVAVCVLWVRSHFTSDHLTWHYDDDTQPERWETRTTALESSAGEINLTGGTLVKAGHIPDNIRSGIKRFGSVPFKKGFSWERRDVSPYTVSTPETTFGFRWSRASDEQTFQFPGGRMLFTSSDYGVTVPYWCIALVASLPLLLSLPRMKRAFARHARHGLARNLIIAFAPLLVIAVTGAAVILSLRSAMDEPVLAELITVVACVPAAWWGVRRLSDLERVRRERERTSGGRCPGCGCDLRATPGRCPECGESVVRSIRDEGGR